MKEYHIGKPNCPNPKLFLTRVEDILERGVYTNNNVYVTDLENYVCDYLKVNYCVAVSNATVGLELALKSLYKTGKEVLVPSFTFISTIHSIVNAGLKPVFCEIKDDFTIDSYDLEQKISSKTAAIVPVNLFGNLCNLKYIEVLAGLDIPIVYDSAHALGIYDETFNQYVGNYGDCEVFSLHATKFINGFEGGLVTTNNKDTADSLRKARNFGFIPFHDNREGFVDMVGTNAKMSEIHAAMALTNLESIQEIQEHNYNVWTLYREYLPKKVDFWAPNNYFSNYSYIVIEVNPDKRNSIIRHMVDNHIYVRTYFVPNHLRKPYFDKNLRLPRTEEIANKIMCLPTGISIEREDVEYICSKLKEIV